MLTWQDDRWHLDGRPIHAGTIMVLIGGGRSRNVIRIETTNRGRTLLAFKRFNGLDYVHTIDCDIVDGPGSLEWPTSSDRDDA